MRWPLALALLLGAAPAADATTDFVTFAYHDVKDAPGDLEADAVTIQNLAAQFDWLRDQSYRVISIDDVLAAHRGERPLPPRAVLLSFDDGFESHYTRVFPLLQAFNYPTVFAIVGSWIEPPEGTRLGDVAGGPPRSRFVSWEELREMRRSGLAEIASHTYGLHTEVPGNVEGSRYPAASARAYGRRGFRTDIVPIQRPPSPRPRFGDVLQLLASPYSRFVDLAGRLVGTAIDHGYDPRTGRYESDAEYAERVRADLARNSALIEARVGVRPRVVVWPYGRYNEVAVEAAQAEGMPVTLTLDPERSDAREPWRIARYYLAENPDLKVLAGMLEKTPEVRLARGLCLSLDELDAPTAEEREARLGRAIDLVAGFQPSLVLLGAAASGGGVYFPNDRLPVRADLFGRATWQLRTRAGVGVYAEVPLEAAGVEAVPAVFVMACVWVAGALFYWWFEERGGPRPDQPPVMAAWPHAAVIVPCHDEAPHVVETVRALTRLRYPDYEVIAVNDGSTDATGRLLDALAAEEPRLRVVHLPANRGKAAALRAGVGVTDAAYVICVDGDALLDEHALAWLVRALASDPAVGGVTGNPRVRTRSTALGRLQVGEFSSLIGLIKRAQMVTGRLFTVSGVVCGFRTQALAEVGYWRTDALTEDVDVSWRLQLAGWRLRFEPRALCWILMPETLRGLWRQRLRWATGGAQVFVRSLPRLGRLRSRGMWVIAAEYAVSVAWALVAVTLAALWLVGQVPGVSLPVSVGGLVPRQWGLTLGAMFLVQVAVGLALDRRYEPGAARHFGSVIGYPLAFWILTALTVVVGLPRALLASSGRQAVWVSPDRGLQVDA